MELKEIQINVHVDCDLFCFCHLKYWMIKHCSGSILSRSGHFYLYLTRQTNLSKHLRLLSYEAPIVTKYHMNKIYTRITIYVSWSSKNMYQENIYTRKRIYVSWSSKYVYQVRNICIRKIYISESSYMYREVRNICIRKIYISETSYMYREVRNICIRIGKYIYQEKWYL